MIPERQDFITLSGVNSGNYVYYQDYIDLYIAAEKQEQKIKKLEGHIAEDIKLREEADKIIADGLRLIEGQEQQIKEQDIIIRQDLEAELDYKRQIKELKEFAIHLTAEKIDKLEDSVKWEMFKSNKH